MRLLFYGIVSAILVLAVMRSSLGQSSSIVPAEKLSPPVGAVASHASAPETATAAQQLGTTRAEIENLHTQQAALQNRAQDDDLKKKVEILEKQIDTLEKLVK